MTFKIGDCVVLHGIPGPVMSVESVDELVRCMWFDRGVLNRQAFHANAMRVASDEEVRDAHLAYRP